MRKTLIIFMMILICSFIFAGCGANSFSATYLSYTNISPAQRDITLITSIDDMSSYSEQSRFAEASAEFKEKLDSYTAEFFETSMLVVINLAERSSSTQISVTNVNFTDTEVKVTLKRKTKTPATDLMKEWSIFVEFPAKPNISTASYTF